MENTSNTASAMTNRVVSTPAALAVPATTPDNAVISTSEKLNVAADELVGATAANSGKHF